MNSIKTRFLFLSIAFVLLLQGCDDGLYIVKLEIEGTPNRILYIANVDDEIDLSGFILVITIKQGDRDEELLEGGTDQSGFLKVSHEIDFTKPGIYKVELYYGDRETSKLSYEFFVQVVDDEVYNGLKQAGGIRNGD